MANRNISKRFFNKILVKYFLTSNPLFPPIVLWFFIYSGIRWRLKRPTIWLTDYFSCNKYIQIHTLKQKSISHWITCMLVWVYSILHYCGSEVCRDFNTNTDQEALAVRFERSSGMRSRLIRYKKKSLRRFISIIWLQNSVYFGEISVTETLWEIRAGWRRDLALNR